MPVLHFNLARSGESTGCRGDDDRDCSGTSATVLVALRLGQCSGQSLAGTPEAGSGPGLVHSLAPGTASHGASGRVTSDVACRHRDLLQAAELSQTHHDVSRTQSVGLSRTQ